MAKILLVEDDEEIAELIKIHVRDLGHEIEHESDGHDGLTRALAEEFDLLILDLMLPSIDGTEICKRYREQKKNVPILMLTAKSEEFDKVLGLELGADDYVTKPFSVRELIARIKALLRRVDVQNIQALGLDGQKQISFGTLHIDLERRKITLGDNTIELTAKEYDLIVFLASQPGRTFSRADLLDKVWGYQYSGYEHTVNSHINRVRAKIESDPSKPRYIRTVWGVGYRFAEPEEMKETLD